MAEESLTREEARKLLRAAGLLATNLGIPADLRRVPEDEIRRAGTLRPGAPSVDEIIDADREERFSLEILKHTRSDSTPSE